MSQQSLDAALCRNPGTANEQRYAQCRFIGKESVAGFAVFAEALTVIRRRDNQCVVET